MRWEVESAIDDLAGFDRTQLASVAHVLVHRAAVRVLVEIEIAKRLLVGVTDDVALSIEFRIGLFGDPKAAEAGRASVMTRD